MHNMKTDDIYPRSLATCALLLLIGAFGRSTGLAQTNSWITSASDKWETAGDWSLGFGADQHAVDLRNQLFLEDCYD